MKAYLYILLLIITGITSRIYSQSKYEKLKAEISKEKTQLLIAYNNNSITIDSISNYFTSTLVNKIIPHWYGTPWDYEGHTNTPNQGEIACGYFVSTTLKHMETNFNRYRYAQQHSLKGVNIIAQNDTIYKINRSYDTTLVNTLNKLNSGLYIVGLSNHIGFLLKEKNSIYFIHSSYYSPVTVCKEKINNSIPFQSSEVYYLSRISNNKNFLLKWLKNEEIKI